MPLQGTSFAKQMIKKIKSIASGFSLNNQVNQMTF